MGAAGIRISNDSTNHSGKQLTRFLVHLPKAAQGGQEAQIRIDAISLLVLEGSYTGEGTAIMKPGNKLVEGQ